MSIVPIIKRIRTLLLKPFYKLRHNNVRYSANIGYGTFLRDSSIGKYCYVGRNCVLNSVEVGNYSCIAAGVQIGGMEHSYKELSISPKLMDDKCILGTKTIIGHDVWIGANCIIKQGVSIGNGAVVGANSFVNKNVDSYAIVFGSPAKFYKFRDCKNKEEELDASEYWEKEPKEAKTLLEGIAQL